MPQGCVLALSCGVCCCGADHLCVYDVVLTISVCVCVHHVTPQVTHDVGVSVSLRQWPQCQDQRLPPPHVAGGFMAVRLQGLRVDGRRRDAAGQVLHTAVVCWHVPASVVQWQSDCAHQCNVGSCLARWLSLCYPSIAAADCAFCACALHVE